MLKIRLMRIGARKRPFYRVVVVDERAKRTGGYIELLGTYNPLTEPKDIKLKQDRIDHWIKQGAQMSTGYLRIIGKAPQRPPRKPKKSSSAKASEGQGEKKEEPKPTETAAESVSEETPTNTSDGGPEGDSSEVSKADKPAEENTPEPATTEPTPEEPTKS